MYGTLRGALAGRKIAFDRDGYTATVEGRIVGVGKTIRIQSIHMHYELAVPAESREATERAPENWAAWVVLAQASRAVGDRAVSRSAFERAARLNPRAPQLSSLQR